MALFGKSKKELAQEERAKLLGELKEALAENFDSQVHTTISKLAEGNHLASAETSYAIIAAIDTFSRRNPEDGLGLALWSLNVASREAPLRDMISEKILSIVPRVDKGRMNSVATIAMATGLVVSVSDEGSDLERRGLKEWNAAMDILSSRKDGLQFAFAAASNAALGFSQGSVLRKTGVEKWQKIVTELATTDRTAALAEIQRVLTNYNEGFDSQPFKLAAQRTLRQIQLR